jgi:hypothetical protein
MNLEKSVNIKENKSNILNDSECDEKKISGRVDINVLLAKVRGVQKKERITSLVFFGIFALLFFIVGIILSL